MSIDISKIKHNSQSTTKKEENWWDFLNKDIKIGSNKFSDKKKERFYSDLHTLISSGIDIKTALELIIEGLKKRDEKVFFSNVMEDVISGKTLSDSLNETGKISSYEYHSLRIGEESGKTINVLKELSTYFDKKITQNRQLKSAFSYPIIVTVIAFAAVFFMINYVVPMFVDVYKRFGSELPTMTQTVINISVVFKKYIGMVVLLIISLIVFLYLQRKQIWYRKASTGILLKLPIVGEILKKVYMARFAQSMALLISAKTPILRAIQLVKDMINFYPYEVALEKIEKDILNGMSLHESMKQFPIFDNRAISLIKVAEEVNELDKNFDKLNKQYSDAVEYQVKSLGSKLEPIMLIVVGAIVTFILLAMYMPMFEMGTQIHE